MADIGSLFLSGMDAAQRSVHQNSKDKGFWEGPEQSNIPTKIALIHSEVSEVLEAHRKGNPQSEKCPAQSLMAEELADTVIRVMDLAEYLKIDLGRAIMQKANYNESRPHRHGKSY